MKETLKNKKIFWLHSAIISVVVVAAYYTIFHAGFMTWDDPEYVMHNKDITAFSAANIANWFSAFYIGNYHPLTMFSYTIDYGIGGSNPLIYHVTNILLHILNAILLYLLADNLAKNKNVAFFTALLFALHPVQTESVAWIAERKTVLSGFFFLSALLLYANDVDKPATLKKTGVFLLAIAAMLSKGVAVALPVCLFAIDIWKQRNFKDKAIWLQKIPLFLAAILAGIVAVYAEQSGGFLQTHHAENTWQTILFAATAYMQYIIRLLAPLRLSVIYPYPREAGLLQYAFLLLAVGIASLFFVALKRKWHILAGGILFYTANIVFVLQFVHFGEVLTADRYLYIASIGIWFPIVYYLYSLRKAIATAILGTACIALLVLTFLRNDIWLSEFNFYQAILRAFPESSVAQNSMGGVYMRMGNSDEALLHIHEAIDIDPENYKAWYNEGVVYMRMGKLHDAIEAFNKSIEIADYYKAHFSRGLIHEQMGNAPAALTDMEAVLQHEPDNARAYYIKASCMQQQGNMQQALDDYNNAIEQDDTDPLFFMRRGSLLATLHQYDKAINDLNTAIALKPDMGASFYFRGIIKAQIHQNPCPDLTHALSLGYKQAKDAIDTMCK